MNLLDIRGCVTPEDAKTHVRIPFELGQACERLNLRFEYAPKVLEDRGRALELLAQSFELYILPDRKEQAALQADKFLPLKNLITLSLDDGQGYRGACHRHDPVQELFVSETAASPGLMAGRLEAGPWRVTLSMHCIVTDICDYRLQIWTSEEGAPS